MTSASLIFTNADKDDSARTTSIEYTISAADRDWVFVTSSQIDERIARVRKFAPNQLGPRTIMVVGMLAMTLLLMLVALSSERARTRSMESDIDAAVKGWRAEGGRDIADLLVRMEKLRIHKDSDSTWWAVLAPIGFPAALALLFGSLSAWVYFSPLYNFLWGDYIRFYEGRRSKGRLILVGVGLALIVSVVANLISARFHL
jgi:hypothetical protein